MTNTGETGRYSNATGLTSGCTPCLAGYSQNAPGQTACVPCVKGQSSTTGQSACQSCQTGRYTSKEGSGSCIVRGFASLIRDSRDALTDV